jgi:hypothetical protein
MAALVTKEFEYHRVQYQLRLVKCNKPNCAKCPHGPYWYAVVKVGTGKPVTRYVGKKLRGDVLAWYNSNQDKVTTYETL